VRSCTATLGIKYEVREDRLEAVFQSQTLALWACREASGLAENNN